MNSSISCLGLALWLLSMTSLADCKPASDAVSSTGQGGCSYSCVNNVCQSKCGEGTNCVVCINNECSNDCALAEQISRNAMKVTQDNIAWSMNNLQKQMQDLFSNIFG